jgi:hypothetical protein
MGAHGPISRLDSANDRGHGRHARRLSVGKHASGADGFTRSDAEPVVILVIVVDFDIFEFNLVLGANLDNAPCERNAREAGSCTRQPVSRSVQYDNAESRMRQRIPRQDHLPPRVFRRAARRLLRHLGNDRRARCMLVPAGIVPMRPYAVLRRRAAVVPATSGNEVVLPASAQARRLPRLRIERQGVHH